MEISQNWFEDNSIFFFHYSLRTETAKLSKEEEDRQTQARIIQVDFCDLEAECFHSLIAVLFLGHENIRSFHLVTGR